MRMWRFTEAGLVKDAGVFDDTFGLMENVPPFIKYSTLSKEDREKMSKAIDKGDFDYLCLFRGQIFPIRDGMSRDYKSVMESIERAKSRNLLFDISADIRK